MNRNFIRFAIAVAALVLIFIAIAFCALESVLRIGGVTAYLGFLALEIGLFALVIYFIATPASESKIKAYCIDSCRRMEFMKRYAFGALVVVPCIYVPYVIALRQYFAYDKLLWLQIVYFPGILAAIFVPKDVEVFQICAALAATVCLLVLLIRLASKGMYQAMFAAFIALLISIPSAWLGSILRSMHNLRG